MSFRVSIVKKKLDPAGRYSVALFSFEDEDDRLSEETRTAKQSQTRTP